MFGEYLEEVFQSSDIQNEEATLQNLPKKDIVKLTNLINIPFILKGNRLM